MSAHVLPPTLPHLVGRERELATLRAALDAALAGHGSLVLIGGEAGIGKTALAEALLGEATRRGALALVGRCYDLAETPPYGPWRELFERAPGEGDLPALPAAVRADGHGEDATSQEAIARRVRDYLAALASRQPLVALLEDLHWADPASLDLLRVVARGLASLPLLLLATYRDDEPADVPPLAALLPALVREAHAARLTPARLDGAAMRSLARGRYALPDDDEARLVGYLQARAEGNPLYLGELLRSLEEAGTLRPAAAGRWALGELAGARVPPLLRQVIGARAARLGEETGRLLAMAAVLGQVVPLALWAAVAQTGEDGLADAVGRATGARMLAETPDGAGVRFAHALVRQALYEAIPLPRRRRLHHRAAEALLTAPAPDPDAVAGHLQRAGDPRTVEWLVRAGHRAHLAFASRTAAERYETAAALLDDTISDPDRRGWVFLYLALARYLEDARGGMERLEFVEQLAVVADDRPLAAYARFLRGYHRSATGDFRGGVADMLAGATALDNLTAAERARFEMPRNEAAEYASSLAIRLAYVGRYEEARRWSLRNHEQGHAYRASFAMGETYAALGQADEARESWARGRAGARQAGDLWTVGLFTKFELHGAILPYWADDLGERRRLADQSEQAFSQAGELHQMESVRFGRLPLLVLEGHWAEARSIAANVCAKGRAYRPGAASLLASVAYAQGDLALATALIIDLLPTGPAEEPGGTWHHDGLRLQRLASQMALDAGDLTEARAWLEAHDRWLAWNGAVRGRAEGQLGWAAYHRAAREPALAREHAEAALAHASEPRQPLALLAIRRLLGELATDARRDAEARAHLDAALALADACAAPYERALCLLALAELRLTAGEADAAAQALEEVRAICTPLEARPALARCDALAARLADAAATPGVPPATPHPAGLTAREAEVLRLVAAGRSNREAAAALSVSERTIERHLENAYRKIGARNRAEATAFALRHRLA